MAAKKCPKCRKTNPRFFTHCISCGTRLDGDTGREEKIPVSVKIGLVVLASILLVIFVVLPAVQYSHTFGRNFSETISAKSAADLQPVTEYPLNRPVENSDLQISVISARDGQNTSNANKFFLVTVYLKNMRNDGNVQISSSDFELIDSEGIRYFPYGIGSKIMYDLSPTQSSSADLTYVIPQQVEGKKIQFTFPGTSTLESDRDIVVFVI
jgi:hypothetical protein